jgi:hypothetical protein
VPHRDLPSEISGSDGGALEMVAVSTSKTSISFYNTTERNIPEDIIFKHMLSNISWLCFFKKQLLLKLNAST